tara:strand:+ start:996 stop:3188 length:2193 start_codon:yes stop_codon:yes gene_type:complete
MKKIIYRSIIILLLIVFSSIMYLSVFGIKTNRFNSQIISQIKNIEPNIEIKINDISAKLNLFTFTLDIKTVGTDLLYKNKKLKLENIKSKISLRSYMNKKFAFSEISISTKSLLIKDLVGFIRMINNDPKLFVAEQFIDNGYIVVDLKLEFDELGKIKENYQINGLINDGKVSLLGKEIKKLNFIFQITNKEYVMNDIKLLLNNKSLLIPELIGIKQENNFLISGKLDNQNLKVGRDDIKELTDNEFIKKNIKEIILSSKSDFTFKIDKKFKFKDFYIKSAIELDYLKLNNFLNLKNNFPKIKEEIVFEDQKIELIYDKKQLKIDGSGNILLQDEPDIINFKIENNQKEFIFDTNLKIKKNLFIIDLLNYKKDKNKILDLNFKGKFNKKDELLLKKISLKENKNHLSINNLKLSNNFKIKDINSVNLNFIDNDNLGNKLQIKKNKNKYLVSGESFSINRIISELLKSKNNNKQVFFDKKFDLYFDIKKIYLDKNNFTNNLKGSLLLKNNEITKLNLFSDLSNNKKINFTIKTTKNAEKITTLFSDYAKPLVDRYEFIKGFNEGVLDFYSIKKNNKSNSTLKIYDFKLKELPALTKILTLASLQGIADLLSGEGIRFNEFEMNFTNEDNLMTIDEIYAIGPAISILMEGYIEKENLISLRGTLVPATTINKTISSIPLIGDILVGKKVGEGVFGVSFKIKGPPKNLETTVNPIKTLTPRFITRTLEKIKKN